MSGGTSSDAHTDDLSQVTCLSVSVSPTAGEFDSSEQAEHGIACEPLIADLYARISGYQLKPGGLYKDDRGYGASPDRTVYAAGVPVGLLEIKAPWNGLYQTGKLKMDHIVQVGAVCALGAHMGHYSAFSLHTLPLIFVPGLTPTLSKMQMQMWLSGFKWCDYAYAWIDHEKPVPDVLPLDTPMQVFRFHYSPDWIDLYLEPRLAQFRWWLSNPTEWPRDETGRPVRSPFGPKLEREDLKPIKRRIMYTTEPYARKKLRVWSE